MADDDTSVATAPAAVDSADVTEPRTDVSVDPAVVPADPEALAPRRAPRRRRGRPSRARGRPNSSDEAAARWTIRGVATPVREMALKAAAERGMTVGDWVAEAIVAYVRGHVEQAPHLPATDAPPDLTQTLRSLDERLTRLEQRDRPGFFGRLFGRRT